MHACMRDAKPEATTSQTFLISHTQSLKLAPLMLTNPKRLIYYDHGVRPNFCTSTDLTSFRYKNGLFSSSSSVTVNLMNLFIITNTIYSSTEHLIGLI